ncbi:M20/M25/M40 family metallo-hydrolase [Streptomyces sp. NPDC090036]|uniref:M20/M25/M40 family metallo-hydrolase n=1 Tax=Streptomyces sp. NPDC090036 TaxID=3365926 RepID=UPI0037F7FABC
MYGRGASDAKGQVICHLWALRAHRATERIPAPAVTLKLLIEGEEEIGSVHLADLLAEHTPQLAGRVDRRHGYLRDQTADEVAAQLRRWLDAHARASAGPPRGAGTKR